MSRDQTEFIGESPVIENGVAEEQFAQVDQAPAQASRKVTIEDVSEETRDIENGVPKAPIEPNQLRRLSKKTAEDLSRENKLYIGGIAILMLMILFLFTSRPSPRPSKLVVDAPPNNFSMADEPEFLPITGEAVGAPPEIDDSRADVAPNRPSVAAKITEPSKPPPQVITITKGDIAVIRNTASIESSGLFGLFISFFSNMNPQIRYLLLTPLLGYLSTFMTFFVSGLTGGISWFYPTLLLLGAYFGLWMQRSTTAPSKPSAWRLAYSYFDWFIRFAAAVVSVIFFLFFLHHYFNGGNWPFVQFAFLALVAYITWSDIPYGPCQNRWFYRISYYLQVFLGLMVMASCLAIGLFTISDPASAANYYETAREFIFSNVKLAWDIVQAATQVSPK